MHHIYLIYSPVDGHWGYFHALTIVNSAAVHIEAHVLFWIMVFSWYTPRSEFAGYMVVVFLVFWGVSIMFSIVAVPIYIPDNSVSGFPSLYILSSICC